MPLLDKITFVYIIVAVGVFMLLVIFAKKLMKKQTEKLENVVGIDTIEPPSHAMETKPEDIPVQPQIFDSGSGSVMSAQDFVPSQFLSPWYKAYTGNMKNYYLLDDGEGGDAGLQYNMCSKSCCGEQYPLPFQMPVDSEVCANKSDFVPNNYMCNNAWQDTGCVCMTKKQAGFIGSRGGNA